MSIHKTNPQLVADQTESSAPSTSRKRFALSHPSVLAWTICILASTFYIYEFFLRVIPSVIIHELMQEFSIGAKAFGIMSAFFFYTYTPMQIPAGLLSDRFGPRVLMTISVTVCALGAGLFGLTDQIWCATLARGLMGLGSSFAFVGALVLVARWFPARYFACIIGIIQFLGCVGAIAGEVPVALMVKHMHWQTIMFLSAAFGLILAVLYGLIIRDAPPGVDIPQVKQGDHSREWHRLTVVCKNPQTWWTGVCAFASWSSIAVFPSLWGVSFLMVRYHTNAIVAAKAMMFVWLGIGLASPIMGWWSDRIQSRNIPLIICYTVGLLAALGILYLPHLTWSFMHILLFLLGCSAASQILTFGVVQDNNPSNVEGTAIGFNNMAVIFTGVVLQPLVGLLLKANWGGVVFRHVAVYALSNYRIALVVMPVCLSLGLLTTLFALRETHCRSKN